MSHLDARHALLGLLVLASALPLAAQTLQVLESTPLRSQRSGDAPALASLGAGQCVTLLQMSGGWVRVQAGSAQGWLRASQLQMPGAVVAAASQRETGRRQDGATAVTLGVRGGPLHEQHALIIGIGQYQADQARPVTALAGMPHDMVSALALAHALQVRMDRVTLLRDGDATREGVQRALRELHDRSRTGDRVFVYWSGRGSRRPDGVGGACVETLVPHDLLDIGQDEWAQWLRPLAAKAGRLMVIQDTSPLPAATATGRADAAAGSGPWPKGLVAKFMPGALACKPSGGLHGRDWGGALREAGLSEQTLVHLASSRPDEASFDDAATGGLATSALRQCLQGDAVDLGGNGAMSVEALVSCAQARVDARLHDLRQPLLQHLVVSGDQSFVPARLGGHPTRP